MKTARIAMTLLLLTVAGCAGLGTTGGTNSPGRRAAAPRTIVRYHVAGFGAAKAGDYLAAPVAMDEFFGSGTNTVAGATGSFDSPLATVFHRGRVFSLVPPTKPWAPFDLLVVEQGRILTMIPDGACKLSLSVDRPVEPERETPVTAPAGAAGTGSSTNRLSLEIVVGECEPALRERLPPTEENR